MACRVPQAALDAIFDELFVEYGGYTIAGHHPGKGQPMEKANEVVKRAQQKARSEPTWADLSNALFDPVRGLVTRAYPTRAEREAFIKTDEYKKIRQLLRSAVECHGLVEGATPRKSGRFVVRLPRSLHAALEREAAEEGVSLNQLVVAKLAAQLRELVLRAVPQPPE